MGNFQTNTLHRQTNLSVKETEEVIYSNSGAIF